MKNLTTVKQGKATTIQNRSLKRLTEEREILNRRTDNFSELYNHKANGDPSILNFPQTDTEEDDPILPKEVEAAVQSFKKEKSAGVDIPAELVQAGGEDVITTPTTICSKIWQTGEWPTCGPSPRSLHFPRKATCCSARTTEGSASSATQAKPC